jgi:hypothetical protein
VLTVAGSQEVKAVIDAHGARIADEVLATELVFVSAGEGDLRGGQQDRQDMNAIDLDGITAYAAINRIQ